MQAIHIFGFGRKEEPQSFITDITVEENLEEIKEIAPRQSRLKPGGSAFSAIAFWIIVELGTTKLGNNNDHTTNIVTTAILGTIILRLFINI